MIFEQRVPPSMASLPGRRHTLDDDETIETAPPEDDPRTKVCKACRERKPVGEYRIIKSQKKGTYARLICRECERKQNRNVANR